MLDREISELIEAIAPLNNRYRSGIEEGLDSKEILKIMWDVGEILVERGIKNVHPVAWKIYGKEEGVRRSYITRDFLSYCFRIRKYFKNKTNIEDEFPSVKRYSLFREAFPLLENPKYKLDGEEKAGLIRLLNSNLPFLDIKDNIVQLKKERIQIANDRRQRLGEMVAIKSNFIDISGELSNLFLERDLQKARLFRNKIGVQALQLLSQLCLGLTQEGLSMPTVEQISMTNPEESWTTFGSNLIRVSSSDLALRNRFRRVIPASRLMEVAEMFNALRSDDGYSNYLTKKGIHL